MQGEEMDKGGLQLGSKSRSTGHSQRCGLTHPTLECPQLLSCEQLTWLQMAASKLPYTVRQT